MSELIVEQKSVIDLFQGKNSDFLIPDYQRPYAWGEEECQTLWEDFFTFAFPDNNCDKFDSKNDMYFLGPIVTFRNEAGKKEVIDGQQRLTTILLLLRAFYVKYGSMQNDRAKKTSESIAKCIWETDEFGNPNKLALKINSEVASDDEKDEFLSILKDGIAEGKKSRYAENYRFFLKQIENFQDAYPDFFSFLPIRILNNCMFLPIEAGSQESALRIFSTLNDRGLPLSDADIFKAQFYKFYSGLGKKVKFVEKWKCLEACCNKIFQPTRGTSMDEIFTRYMYYERALHGTRSSTTEALRTFYERNSYELLKREDTFENIIDLADFWNDVKNQETDRFSNRILQRLFVLNYAPNGMWTYFVSVYYMANKDKDGLLDEDAFFLFLNRTIGFVWAYSVMNPGVNALRSPIFAEMINIVNHQEVEFKDYRFDRQQLENSFHHFIFSNFRTITRSMLAWWAFQIDGQTLLSLETVFEIEHIFAKNRLNLATPLSDVRSLESLGNKALLEKSINIRASDYKFCDKAKYYCGFVENKNKRKEGTKIQELLNLANEVDFTEADIKSRHDKIINGFINFLADNNLINN